MSESDGTLRDSLAVERTRLANERTLLSYVRTALGLAAGGFGLIHIAPGPPSERIGGTMMVVGAGVVLLGVGRFIAVRRRLRG